MPDGVNIQPLTGYLTLDDSGYRFGSSAGLGWWLLPGAVATCLILVGFSFVLRQRPLPPPASSAVEARLIEVQPTVVGGLQGNGAKSITPPAPVPKPIPKHKREVARTHPIVPRVAPPTVVNNPPNGGIALPSSGAGGSSATEGGPGEGIGGSGGGGGGGGIGTDSVGARAIYAPTPRIPDELREDALQTEAIAHFTVSPDGTVTVILTKPTSNPRLNRILLETLRQWRFFPAVKDGVAINSVFDVRIPITIQ